MSTINNLNRSTDGDSMPVDQTSVAQLTPEEANRIIHSHRKVRYGTACWPCRQRKVKCDNAEPCENCVKREHPQLCSYKPARAVKKSGATAVGSSQNRKRTHSSDEGRDDATKRNSNLNAQSGSSSLGTFDDAGTPEVRYLGQNSIPALLRHQSSQEDEQDQNHQSSGIRREMHSILGLDNSAPFPLMSPGHLERLSTDILAELPSDREVMKLFRTYKEMPQLFWGFITDIDALENKLVAYLESRAAKKAGAIVQPDNVVSASWLAILFAVLAVGSQYHDSPYHVRTSNAQKYLQISFHFLRMGNFLLRPSLDSLQALLMLSFCLLNDMKAEASWALLGMTCRLAFSLGLHKPITGTLDSPEAISKDLTRRKLWWCCVWHDTLTSLSFDRYPMTNVPCCPIPMRPEAQAQGWTYLEAMYELNAVIARRLDPDSMAAATYQQILINCSEIESVRDSVMLQLRNKTACKTAVDRLQYYAVRLHTAFFMSVCCRPALRIDNTNLTKPERKHLVTLCKEHLTETLRMFLLMHQLTVIPTRSWAFTYHGLSSALLLGLLPESRGDVETRQLQGELITALSTAAAKEQSTAEPHITRTDRDIELSGPLSRALTALRNIYEHGSVVGNMFNGTRSGTRTPMSIGHLTNQVGDAHTQDAQREAAIHPSTHTKPDPHQDAARTMTELQNGGLPSAVNSNLAAFQPTPGLPTLPMDDLANSDPMSSTQPMQLYDSIFWDAPNPWNGSLDGVNFDFLSQPTPAPGHPSQQQFYF